jgi:hypothetical protein
MVEFSLRELVYFIVFSPAHPESNHSFTIVGLCTWFSRELEQSFVLSVEIFCSSFALSTEDMFALCMHLFNEFKLEMKIQIW